ncbi:hypothetical protein [Paraburkholderia fungorum]|uniref:hypothetical protein n=1 Tax=Paraburkholderia fungorum TaxID=134537 RepID=UPI0038BB6E6B
MFSPRNTVCPVWVFEIWVNALTFAFTEAIGPIGVEAEHPMFWAQAGAFSSLENGIKHYLLEK